MILRESLQGFRAYEWVLPLGRRGSGQIKNNGAREGRVDFALRVQVPNNHIFTQNLYYNYYYPRPKYLIIGYLDPLGCTAAALKLGPEDAVGSLKGPRTRILGV